MITTHTSPTATLGQNANGGLNVYVRELCMLLSQRGVATDVFTRRVGAGCPDVEDLAPLSRDTTVSHRATAERRASSSNRRPPRWNTYGVHEVRGPAWLFPAGGGRPGMPYPRVLLS